MWCTICGQTAAAIHRPPAAWAVPTGQELLQQMTRTMQVMMPLTVAYFAFVTAAGLSLYRLVSNCFSITQQHLVTGWGCLRPQAPDPVARRTRRATE